MIAGPRQNEPDADVRATPAAPRLRSPRALLAGGTAAVRSLRSGLVAGERPSLGSESTAPGRDGWRMGVAVIVAALFLLAVTGALFLL